MALALSPRPRRYVFTSSVAAYGEGLDLDEDSPLAPDDHPDDYVRNKAQTEAKKAADEAAAKLKVAREKHAAAQKLAGEAKAKAGEAKAKAKERRRRRQCT